MRQIPIATNVQITAAAAMLDGPSRKGLSVDGVVEAEGEEEALTVDLERVVLRVDGVTVECRTEREELAFSVASDRSVLVTRLSVSANEVVDGMASVFERKAVLGDSELSFAAAPTSVGSVAKEVSSILKVNGLFCRGSSVLTTSISFCLIKAGLLAAQDLDPVDSTAGMMTAESKPYSIVRAEQPGAMKEWSGWRKG